MRFRFLGSVCVVSAVWVSAAAGLAMQTPAAGGGKAVSSALQPAVDTLQHAIGGLKLEKWKGGSVRDEASANVQSIQKDLQTTLPSMVADADAANGKVSALLPVSHNVDALYDVLLRVVDGARIAGSGDQVQALMQAQAELEKARRALDGQIADGVAAQEKQIGDLQATLKAVPPPMVCPAAPEEKPAAPTVKKKVKKKPAAVPSAPAANAPPAAKPN